MRAVPAAVGGEIRPLSDAEFALFRNLIYREAGIHLAPAKKALLVGRLSRRVRDLGLRSFREYYAHVTRGPDPDEKARMVERMCTHETHFFREPRQFEFLERSVFPGWEAAAAERRRPRRIRAWSAGCSTGQEPFSLAMSLLSWFPAESGWSVEVVGTDLSRKALAVAEEATWPIDRVEEIPADYRKRFMLRGVRSQEGRLRAGPELRSVVRFRPLNLNDQEYSLDGPFDLVLCRNVLIYFDDEGRRRVVERLVSCLAPEGYLLVGHAETLYRPTDRLRSVGPAAYTPARPRPVTPDERWAGLPPAQVAR
jgi:chemotaxis protein methyltransferase CheR